MRRRAFRAEHTSPCCAPSYAEEREAPAVTVGLLFGIGRKISRPLGHQSKNRFDGCIRKDTARAAVTADFDHAELSQLEPSSR